MKIGLFSREAFPSPFSPIFALQTPDVRTNPANHSKVKFKSGLSQLNDGAEASCLPAGRTRCSLQKAERLLHLWFFCGKSINLTMAGRSESASRFRSTGYSLKLLTTLRTFRTDSQILICFHVSFNLLTSFFYSRNLGWVVKWLVYFHETFRS